MSRRSLHLHPCRTPWAHQVRTGDRSRKYSHLLFEAEFFPRHPSIKAIRSSLCIWSLRYNIFAYALNVMKSDSVGKALSILVSNNLSSLSEICNDILLDSDWAHVFFFWQPNVPTPAPARSRLWRPEAAAHGSRLHASGLHASDLLSGVSTFLSASREFFFATWLNQGLDHPEDSQNCPWK